MTPSAEKLPHDFAPVLTRREQVAAWFLPPGEAHWLRRLRWMRVGGLVIVLSCLAYVAVAGAAFGFVRYWRQTPEVAFTDLLLPTRWDNYRVARGNQQLAEAKQFVEKQKFMEAFLYARTGLAQAPANRDGRLLLFELLLAARRPEDARRTLLDGLRYHAADPVYLRPVLTFLLRRQEDAHVMALAHRFLPAVDPDSESGRLLALAAATASYFRGNYDQAEDFLRAGPKLPGSRDGRLLFAKIAWERGYHELALLKLRQLADELPRDGEVHRDLVAHLRLQGLTDEARRSSLAFQIAFPAQPEPRIELLFAYQQAGDQARVAREADALLRDFPADEAALLALADFAANAGDVALMRRTASQAAQHALAPEAFAMLTVETLVVAHDFQGALDAISRDRADFPAWERQDAGLFDSLEAAAYLGLHDDGAAGMFLGKFLTQSYPRAENLLAVANRFNDLGAGEQARRTLARAVEVDPLNQAALTRLVELDVTLNAVDDLAVHVQRLVRMRQPSPDTLRVAQLKLGSDLFLLSKDRPPALEAVRLALARIDGDGAVRR